MTATQRYILLQIPGLALAGLVAYWLVREELIPIGGAWALVILWILKDAAFYPLVRKAYGNSPGRHVGREYLEGSVVVVEERLDPDGWVRLRGERWKARASRGALEPGDRARVLVVRDLTLELGPNVDDGPEQT